MKKSSKKNPKWQQPETEAGALYCYVNVDLGCPSDMCEGCKFRPTCAWLSRNWQENLSYKKDGRQKQRLIPVYTFLDNMLEQGNPDDISRVIRGLIANNYALVVLLNAVFCDYYEVSLSLRG